MNGRFELLMLSEAQCLVRFRNQTDAVLLASSTIPGVDLAERTIEWLRAALQKDWLYQIGRAYQGNGPMFTLSAPFGVVCSSPAFSSSDAMERAISGLKKAAPAAPVVKLAGSREGRIPAPLAAPLPRAEPVSALARASLPKKQPPAGTEPHTGRMSLRER